MLVALAFVILLFLGVPIAFVLGLAGLAEMASTGSLGMILAMPQQMTAALDNFSLLAVPLFILAGELMNYGGITRRLVDFALSLVGHLRGGLGYVTIVAGTFMAGIMGSATAEGAVLNRVMVPSMEREGYDTDFATAVVGATAVLGPIIPPSMVAVIYGVLATTSIGALFLAGIIPGLLLGGAYAGLVYYWAGRRGYRSGGAWQGFRRVLQTFVVALPALLVPIVILAGIVGGAFTPTESAAVASLLALVIGMFIYRELRWQDLGRVFVNTGIVAGTVLILIATSSIFSFTLTVEQVPNRLVAWMTSLSSSQWVILLVLNLLLLFVGCIMDGIAAMIVLVPLLLPVLEQFQIDPVHFGIIMTMNLTLGLLTPPVGVLLFINSALSRISFERVARASLPFVGAALAVLALVTYVPGLATWIPSLLLQ